MTQVNKIKNEWGYITTRLREIKQIIGKYYEQSYAKKIDNVDEMNSLLERHKLPQVIKNNFKIWIDLKHVKGLNQ